MRLEEAIDKVKEYNRQGLACSLSLLPTTKTDRHDLIQEVQSMRTLIETVHSERLDSDITIKAHQLGLYRDYDTVAHHTRQVMEAAAERDLFVWIDMECKQTVSDTIRLYFEMRETTSARVGICLQTYLERTAEDLERLLQADARIRLVKGFYNTQDADTWEEVTENYRKLMKKLLERGEKPALATHDKDLIAEAKPLALLRQDDMEFQFFAGVNDELATQLRNEGFRVRLYIPYGDVVSFLLEGLSTFDVWRHVQRMFGAETIR